MGEAHFVHKIFNDQDLSAWADCLVDYAEDWDIHFGKFFTQEFWYILVPVTLGYWNKSPVSIGAAKGQMKGLSGSTDRTKENRINEAIKAGYITKCSFADLDKSVQECIEGVDRRVVYLLPTPLLETKMRKHLTTTLSSALEALAAVGGVKGASDS